MTSEVSILYFTKVALNLSITQPSSFGLYSQITFSDYKKQYLLHKIPYICFFIIGGNIWSHNVLNITKQLTCIDRLVNLMYTRYRTFAL